MVKHDVRYVVITYLANAISINQLHLRAMDFPTSSAPEIHCLISPKALNSGLFLALA
jgi:hypothetical protein